jgi:hypothetical protein
LSDTFQIILNVQFIVHETNIIQNKLTLLSWPSPAECFLVLSPTEPIAIFYFLTALVAFRPFLNSESKSKSKFCYDQRLVGQSVLKSNPRLGPRPDFITVREMRVCCCGALSLMRGRVGRLQFLASSSAVVLRSESRGTHDQILLSQTRDYPNMGMPGPRIYIRPGQGGPFIPSGTGFPFRRLLRLTGLRRRYSKPLPRVALKTLNFF